MALLIILFPLMALLAFIVWLETGENPLFTQDRGLTLSKRRFTIYKLRTLRSAEKVNGNGHNDIFKKEELGSRLTFTGSRLRRTGLDELPQLFNVLKGEMSFIGPRPLSLEDLETMKKDFPRHYASRGMITSKPGISGYWQIFGNREEGIENLTALELKYEEEKSFTLDTFLAALTLPVMLFAKHADSISGTRE